MANFSALEEYWWRLSNGGISGWALHRESVLNLLFPDDAECVNTAMHNVLREAIYIHPERPTHLIKRGIQ